MLHSKPALVLHCQTNDSAHMHAKLTNVGADAVHAFTLCFSLLAPLSTLDNCIIVDSIGGFSRLRPKQPISLEPGQTWDFRFAYDQQLDNFSADNIAFGPQAAYIEMGDQKYTVQTQPMRFAQALPETSTMTTVHEVDQQLKLIPAPVSWQAESEHLLDSKGFRLVPVDNVHSANKAWLDVEKLSQRLGIAFSHPQGVGIQVSYLTPTEDITNACTEDAYQLHISLNAVSVQASGERGFFYALISLLQLHCNYAGQLPCGLIVDRPRFAWRGQHLDCARQFVKPEHIAQTLDLMALVKLNHLHWHAVDDEAFRFELQSAPQLARTGWRGHEHWLPGVFGGGMGPTGGTYSKTDMHDIVQRARELNIRVMAEIDLPGHALALTYALPELHEIDNSATPARSIQGYCNNTVNPGLSSTMSTLKPILSELKNLFPDAPLHIGGDEVADGAWDHSDAVHKLKQQHQLHSQQHVQGWFMQQIAAIVYAEQGQVAAWEEAANGQPYGLGEPALLFAWRSLASGQALARAGQQVILCPAQHTYLDMSFGTDAQSIGANWAGHLPLAKTTSWQPVPEDEPELEKNIKGIQGALWSETIHNFDMLQRALAPRIFGIAEMAWCNDDSKRQGKDLSQAVRSLYPLLKAIKWQFTHV